jgi:tetratricopeptide (TPR) repeat protein
LIGWLGSSGLSPPPATHCVEVDDHLDEMINESCSVFHRALRWPEYPRTLEDDVACARDLAGRGDVTRQAAKVRSFFLLCSDPVRTAWDGAADPLIGQDLRYLDTAGLVERGLLHRPEFLLIFFGGYLTRAGYFDDAEIYYKDLIRRGLEAEGLLGLADIRHLLANWRVEQEEPKARNVIPQNRIPPAGYERDRILELHNYTIEAAIDAYERAVSMAPHVSFYRLHLARALIDRGDLQRARAELERAASSADCNPIVPIYLEFVDRLMNPSSDDTSCDFLPVPVLRQRYHTVTPAMLTTVDELAQLTGATAVVLCERTRLRGEYVTITNGQPVTTALDLDFPEPKGLRLPVMRDLGLGLKLALEQFVVDEGPRAGLQRLKLFARPVLMTAESRVLIGLPEQQQVIRGNKPLVPLPGAAFNYYHWTIDSMGAAALLDQNLALEDVELITTHPIEGWRKEILDRVLPGITPHVLGGSPEHNILVDALHLPHPARLNIPHPLAVRLLRQRMSTHGKPLDGKRVVVARPRGLGRRTVNEDAIHDFLARRGFEVFDPAGKSVAEQIAYFADVEVLVSPGGAALTNLLFCPTETKVVILASTFHYQETFTALAIAIGQRVWVCLGGCETRPNPYLIWSVFDQDVPLEDVIVAVDQACDA